MKDEKFHFSLIVNEVLGLTLFNPGLTELGKKLLFAYAAHKFTIYQNDGFFYKTLELRNAFLSTERRLINRVIINFEASLIPINANEKYNFIIYEKDFENAQNYEEEREFRRYVNENHPHLIKNLNGSCTDFSNLNFHSRELEILFDKYRLCINPHLNTYSIQYKKSVKKCEIFLPSTLTREIMYINHEGPSHKEPVFIVQFDENSILGLGSFLECSNLAVKTVYLKYYSIILYQRVIPDDYSQSFPFIIEYEEQQNSKRNYYKEFFSLCLRLDARISNHNSLDHFQSPFSKPHHVIDEEEKMLLLKKVYLKFDGIPSTLRFYRYHFVIYNSAMSESFNHSLPEDIIYILRDYSFLVEANLYKSKHEQKFPKPNPMIIIDIQTTAFNTEYRMNIIEILRKSIGGYLHEYFIFFQGEPCVGINSLLSLDYNQNNVERNLINHGIYEVILDPQEGKIKRVCRQRPDKRKPNDGILVNTIKVLQKKKRKLSIMYP